MAEDPRIFLHFKTLEKFQEKLNDGTINPNKHFVVIKDEGLIWVKGKVYSNGNRLENLESYYNDWEIIPGNDKDGNVNKDKIRIILKGKEWSEDENGKGNWVEKNKSLELTTATQNIAGLMSTKDKKAVDNLIKLSSFSHIDDNEPFTPSEDKVLFNYNCRSVDKDTSSENTQHNPEFPVANDTQAGIITAEEHKLLNTDIPEAISKELKDREEAIKELSENKVDIEDGKGLSSNDFTDVEKNKLEGITNYVIDIGKNQDNNDLISIIYTTYNANSTQTKGHTININSATQTAAGLMSASDKTKLDKIVNIESINTNPNYNETGITIPVNVNNINTETNSTKQITIGGATSTKAGMFVASDKRKLDGIETNAQVNVQPDWDEENKNSDAYIKNKPESLPANGGNSATVNNHSVNSDVPANAKFTDTTYTVGSGDSNGQIKVTPSSGSAYNVNVTGLKSAAYTESSAYATSAQGTKADNAVPNTRTINRHPLSSDITISASDVGLGNVTNLSKTTMFTSPAFTGTPTAPTAAAGTNTTQIATTAYVKTEINNVLAASDAMLYKGTLGTGGTITSLPNTHSKGDTYKIITAGTYAGVKCEVGDMIICLNDGTAAKNDDWTVILTNIDGAVTGPSSAVGDRVATFNGTTGKVIKDSGFTIATSVPANAKFTDTTYSAGTGLSLSGTIFNHSNSVTSKSLVGYDSNIKYDNPMVVPTYATYDDPDVVQTMLQIPYFSYDEQGHITTSGIRRYFVNGFHGTYYSFKHEIMSEGLWVRVARIERIGATFTFNLSNSWNAIMLGGISVNVTMHTDSNSIINILGCTSNHYKSVRIVKDDTVTNKTQYYLEVLLWSEYAGTENFYLTLEGTGCVLLKTMVKAPSDGFTVIKQIDTKLYDSITTSSNATIGGSVTANNFVKNGGNNTQILLADGSTANFYRAAAITSATSDNGAITPLGMKNWTESNFYKKPDIELPNGVEALNIINTTAKKAGMRFVYKPSNETETRLGFFGYDNNNGLTLYNQASNSRIGILDDGTFYYTVGSASTTYNKVLMDGKTFQNNIELRKGSTGGQSITTQDFIEILKNLGAFNYSHWEAKAKFKYASNDTITDTGCGNIHLSGAIIEVWSINSTDNYTIRIITAPTASTTSEGIINAVFIYRNQGTSYKPGWTRLANSNDYLPLTGGTLKKTDSMSPLTICSGKQNKAASILFEMNDVLCGNISISNSGFLIQSNDSLYFTGKSDGLYFSDNGLLSRERKVLTEDDYKKITFSNLSYTLENINQGQQISWDNNQMNLFSTWFEDLSLDVIFKFKDQVVRPVNVVKVNNNNSNLLGQLIITFVTQSCTIVVFYFTLDKDFSFKFSRYK